MHTIRGSWTFLQLDILRPTPEITHLQCPGSLDAALLFERAVQSLELVHDVAALQRAGPLELELPGPVRDLQVVLLGAEAVDERDVRLARAGSLGGFGGIPDLASGGA